MLGIFANVLSVVLGGLLGAVFASKIPEGFSQKLTMAFGVCAMGMGVNSIILMENMPAVILSVLLGLSIGIALHLEERIAAAGLWMQKPVSRLLGDRAGSGEMDRESALSLLVTTIVLFCSSGTGIYGCLDAGMTGNQTVLLSKSVLDLFTAAVFACSLGAVVTVVAVPQFLIFLLLYALARVVGPLATPEMINDFRACGGIVLLATGFRVAGIKSFPIADMIPAMLLAMPLSAFWAQAVQPLL